LAIQATSEFASNFLLKAFGLAALYYTN